MALCERLQVTRGSFYHHFEGFDEFVGALLAQWESGSTTQRLAVLPALATDPGEAEDQMLLALTLDHEAEAALRVWAASHDAVAAAVRRVDLLRLDGMRALLLARGLPPADADTWADLAITTLVGLQVLEQPLDVERLRRLLRLVTTALRTCWPEPPG